MRSSSSGEHVFSQGIGDKKTLLVSEPSSPGETSNSGLLITVEFLRIWSVEEVVLCLVLCGWFRTS